MSEDEISDCMSTEKKAKSSVIRRTKKSNNNRNGNKELRQSMQDLTTGMDDMSCENKSRKRAPLKRAKSFHKDLHVQRTVSNEREILKQYVINQHNIDIETDDDLDCDELSGGGELPVLDAIEKLELRDLSIFLLKNHDDLNLEEKNSAGHTPLILAVALELIEVVKLLIAAGSSVDAVDNQGISVLRYAVEGGDFDIASLLISNGANAEVVQDGF